MCGISGIVSKHGVKGCASSLDCMCESIRHRGPDAEGRYFFSNCALGHVRLTIVDLKGGKQPMLSNDGNEGIVFNGEIYGYKDIKRTLDYNFKESNDTEVLLALYRKYGTNMAQHTPGMFAFSIWDEKLQRLYCARDRFGEKPFYYAFGENGEFVFASEIKALIASGIVKPVINYEQIWHYLQYSYIYPTQTIYKNVYTLPPACQLIYENGSVAVEHYWNLPVHVNETISVSDAVDKFQYLFRKAIEKQLIADVPVGAFLSGGLDSGTVVAVASEFIPKLTTISFAFDEIGGMDESPYALEMSQKYNTNHVELHSQKYNIRELLTHLNDIFDEPLGDPATVPAYLIAKAAREHVTVVLTGDAGDELLGGYPLKYRSLKYAFEREQHVKMYTVLKKIITRLDLAYERMRQNFLFRDNGDQSKSEVINTHIRRKEIANRGLSLALKGVGDIQDEVRKMSEIMSESDLVSLGYTGKRKNYYITGGYADNDRLENALRCDLLEYLPGNGFVKTDRTTMAVSLESRTPFCDVDLAEFCLSLPFSLKVSDYYDKYILRESFQDKWTYNVAHNIKRGFSPPFGKWMKESKMLEMQNDLLDSHNNKIYSVLDYNGVQKLRKSGTTWPIWNLIQLSLWMETHSYIDDML